MARALARRPERESGPRVVALDGPSGSGKTSLAAALLPLLGPGARVLHLDDLYPGWDGLDPVVPLLVSGVLEPLAAGRPGAAPRWDWARDRPGEPLVVPAADVLVVEGAGSGSRACAPHLALLVWLETPAALRRARALARDGEAYRPHWQRWAAQERRHFAREGTRERADLVLDTG
ncbi:Uridine kinase [Quadrisphaera sp. DSM 44207]|nr:Uridine kinase [Quadrisphaera sp. DSM 44207]